MRMAQTAGILKIYRGIIGMTAHFHSTRMNKTADMDPSVSIEMTMGLLHSKYVPPPDIGMSNSNIAAELVAIP